MKNPKAAPGGLIGGLIEAVRMAAGARLQLMTKPGKGSAVGATWRPHRNTVRNAERKALAAVGRRQYVKNKKAQRRADRAAALSAD